MNNESKHIIDRFKARLSELEMDFNEEMFQALTRSSAIAILSADKEFIDANENFAKIFDYTSEELFGKNHSDLVQDDKIQNGEYQRFWNELKAGRFIAGEFERINRLGKTVWINGSYNPVVNKKGELVFVIKFATDITKQKFLSLDLSHQHESINNSYNIVHFDLDCNILYANENFCRLMSYEKEELINEPHSKLLFAEDLNDKYKLFWTSLKGGLNMPGEFRRKTRLGKEVWIRGSYNPVFNDKGEVYKVIKYAIDVTQEKIIHNKYKSQLEAINRSNAIIEFDAFGNIISANNNFLDIVGYTKEEIISKNHKIFVAEDEKESEQYKQFWRSLRDGEYLTGEFKRISRTGKPVWIRGSYNPILDSQGNVIRIIKYALDVTAHKKIQETLLKDQEIIHSQAKLAALGQMAAGIAHEINNPLASINALIDDTILRKQEPVKCLNQISSQVTRIKSIIDSLKSLVQNDNQSTQYHSLIEIIQDAFKLAQNTLITNQIEVEFELTPLEIYINKTSMIQIVVNLINNAVYAMKSPQQNKKIIVKSFMQDNYGIIQFIDNGKGVPDNIKDDIFNPFFTTKGPEGTGLGLALARQTLQQVKGDIYINQKVSKSCFEIKLHTNNNLDKSNKDAA